jgi:tetratricopeptide (TPR) repeat protein
VDVPVEQVAVSEEPKESDALKADPIPQAAEASIEPVKTKDADEDKPIIVESKEVQEMMSKDAKLDKYFDSPDGKMLRDIPAPSMNPIKGKNESIIVVNKQGKKSSQKSSKSSSGKAISIQTTDNDSKIVAAGRALALQRYDAAKEMYDDLYQINPRDSRVLMGRAVLFQKLGQTEDAIASYEEVLKYNPDNAEAVVNLAGLIRKQYPAVALNKLLELRQLYPDNAVVAAQLGVTYADSGNYPDAFHYLSMASSMETNNPQHLYNMAVVAERAGDSAKAIQNYEKALEVDAISGSGGKTISRERIYDRLTRLRAE